MEAIKNFGKDCYVLMTTSYHKNTITRAVAVAQRVVGVAAILAGVALVCSNPLTVSSIGSVTLLGVLSRDLLVQGNAISFIINNINIHFSKDNILQTSAKNTWVFKHIYNCVS
jgi:hypothetical protein